ncbi:MAG TPA: hypothetical protein VK037_04765, partial [Pseudogracilibacillus sp.]|nr:hypothetical protein [Pseudogracilibacillus sp.]
PTAEKFCLILRSTFPWCTHRGKVLPDFASNLSVAHPPRKSIARFCVQPFCGALATESFRSILRSTFPWRTFCGKVLPDFAFNLSVAHLPRKTLARFCVERFHHGKLFSDFCSDLSARGLPWKTYR